MNSIRKVFIISLFGSGLLLTGYCLAGDGEMRNYFYPHYNNYRDSGDYTLYYTNTGYGNTGYGNTVYTDPGYGNTVYYTNTGYGNNPYYNNVNYNNPDDNGYTTNIYGLPVTLGIHPNNNYYYRNYNY